MVKEQDASERIRKILGSLSSYTLVSHVAERVFQRVPTIADSLIEETEGLAKSRQKTVLISSFVRKIEALVENREEARKLGLPLKISDYLKYIDLLVLIKRSKYKLWQVYQLTEYRKDSSDLVLADESVLIRHKIKSWFSDQRMLASVQVESHENRIWLSISFTKKTKDRSKDKARLVRSKNYYVVYYPGEPYVYSAGGKMPSDLVLAINECLNAKGCLQVPLSGHHLDSLRQLRLNREGRSDPLTAVPTRDRFTVFSLSSSPQQEGTVQPELDRLNTECNFEFRGMEALDTPASSMADKKMRIGLEVRGPDIIGGLNELVAAGIVCNDPPPRWVTNLPTAGRNKFSLVSGGRRDDHWELQSLASTIMDQR